MRMISVLIRMDHPNARYSTSKQKTKTNLTHFSTTVRGCQFCNEIEMGNVTIKLF